MNMQLESGIAHRPVAPVSEILRTTVEMNPFVAGRRVSVWSVATRFSISCMTTKRRVSSSHPPLAAKNLRNLVSAVDGVSTTPTHHLIMRCSTDATLAHGGDIGECVSIHVKQLGCWMFNELSNAK